MIKIKENPDVQLNTVMSKDSLVDSSHKPGNPKFCKDPFR